jgi:YggT family protein
MQADPFQLQFLPFHVINYALAAVFYTLIGRSILGVFVRQDSPFFVMRFFRLITEPFMKAFRFMTPGFMHPALAPLYVGFWVFLIRLAFGLVMLNYGLAPRLSAAA